MQGTEFIIKGINNESMERAKSMFLLFSGAKLLESTKYGQVLSRSSDTAYIYINGVQVAEEENFMFSYNITNINAQIKKALNRERMNVGRTAYTSSIKSILTQCQSEEVLVELVADLEQITRGANKDESSWVDVSSYAVKILDKIGGVVFITPDEYALLSNHQREILEQSGKRSVLIPDNIKNKLGEGITTFNNIGGCQ